MIPVWLTSSRDHSFDNALRSVRRRSKWNCLCRLDYDLLSSACDAVLGHHVESREPVRRLFRAVFCELRPSTGTQSRNQEDANAKCRFLTPCHRVCRGFHQFREIVHASATQQLSSIFVPNSAMCNPFIKSPTASLHRDSPEIARSRNYRTSPLITLKTGMRISAKQDAVTERAHQLRSGELQQRRSESSNLDGHAQKPQAATAADPLILNRNRQDQNREQDKQPNRQLGRDWINAAEQPRRYFTHEQEASHIGQRGFS